MFEYFPGNYVWNLAVVATLNSGGYIDEVDRACRPVRDLARQGADAGTDQLYAAWSAVADGLIASAEEDVKRGRLIGAGDKFRRASLYVSQSERLQAPDWRQNATNPEGFRYIVDNAWLTGIAPEVTKAIRPLFTRLPTQRSFTIWFSMAPLRELPDMAFSMQSEIYCATYLIYVDPADDRRLRDWLTARMTDLEPVTAGQYLGDSDFTARQLRFMGAEQYRRLQAIRAVRDPESIFVGHLTGDGEPPRNVNPWEAP